MAALTVVERVPLDVVPLHRAQAPHDAVEGGLAALVAPVGVVQLRRPVDRDADEEPVLGEELAPVVVEQRGVGLQRVEHPLARCRELPLELDDAGEEVEPHERRLAALEGDHHLVRAAVRLEQAAEVRREHVVGHPEPAAGVHLLLGQEEAVVAVEVAHGTGGLGHEVERAGSPLRHRHHAPALLDSPHRHPVHARRAADHPDQVRWRRPLSADPGARP